MRDPARACFSRPAGPPTGGVAAHRGARLPPRGCVQDGRHAATRRVRARAPSSRPRATAPCSKPRRSRRAHSAQPSARAPSSCVASERVDARRRSRARHRAARRRRAERSSEGARRLDARHPAARGARRHGAPARAAATNGTSTTTSRHDSDACRVQSSQASAMSAQRVSAVPSLRCAGRRRRTDAGYRRHREQVRVQAASGAETRYVRMIVPADALLQLGTPGPTSRRGTRIRHEQRTNHPHLRRLLQRRRHRRRARRSWSTTGPNGAGPAR